MVPRYTRPQMAAIWSPENRYRIWFEIEALAAEGMARLGEIPAEAAAAIRERGDPALAAISDADIARIDEIERETRHDVIAFLTWLAEKIGPESRFVHLGMTSSDVLDTCLSVQLTQAADLLLGDLDEVLADAQHLGYAEADPTTDIGGFDAGHKITILAALAFGCAPTFAGAEVEGVERVELLDIRLAKDLGYRIKLIATARRSDGGISVRVHPALVPLTHPLALTDGVLNALFIEGRRIGRIFIQGPGAGGGPTAAAVAADIADVLSGAARPVFQSPAGGLRRFSPLDTALVKSQAYVRLLVRDEPGVIAAVSETLAEAGVSIDSFLQKPVAGAGGVPIVLTTHAVAESVLSEAVRRMAALPALLEAPRLIRIARI